MSPHPPFTPSLSLLQPLEITRVQNVPGDHTVTHNQPGLGEEFEYLSEMGW